MCEKEQNKTKKNTAFKPWFLRVWAANSFKILIFIQLILLKRKMVNFELGENIEKVFFRLVTSVGQSKKIWVLM